VTETLLWNDVRPPTLDSDEKPTLLAFLDYVRGAAAAKARGLADGQGRTPAVPSGTSVLGLVKHLTAAELYWFAWAYDGSDIPRPGFGMEITEAETAEGLLAAYRDAVDRSNEIIARCDDLSRPSARATSDGLPARSMRWVLLHMIEETARHAGHADILREQTDGSVGR
jgi:hypothetical protein